MDEHTLRLDQPLPDDVSVGSLIGLSNYRTYPVFSWPWWRGRTLFLGAFVLLYFVVAWLGLSFARKEYTVELALGASAWSAGEFLVFIMLGPALATWVRTRGWPRRKEAVGIVLAITLVTLAGAVANHYNDKALNDMLMSQTERAEAERVRAERSPTAQAAVTATRAIWAVTVVVLLGGGAAAAGYFRERKRLDEFWRRRELMAANAARQEAEVRLSVLQAQVEPHFLFNTLASVRSLVGSDPQRATQLIDHFSAYLRGSIPRLRADGKPEAATLGSQVQMAVNYLEVMRVRMGERLRYQVDLPEGLRDAPMPPLMLISLVENAVKHGLEPKPAGGTVRIGAAREGDTLCVSVADDGVGFGGGATSGSGIGLANIRTRLAQMYGSAARLDLSARPGEGFQATLHLPLAQSTAPQADALHA